MCAIISRLSYLMNKFTVKVVKVIIFQQNTVKFIGNFILSTIHRCIKTDKDYVEDFPILFEHKASAFQYK